MKREIHYIDGEIYMTVSRSCMEKLLSDPEAHSYLFVVSKDGLLFLTNIAQIFDRQFAEYGISIPQFLDNIEADLWYYYVGVIYLVKTGIDSYNEYYEISRDFPLSKERYITLVKRYCKWAAKA